MKTIQQGIILFMLSVMLTSCSPLRRMAINTVADSVSGGGNSVFATDDVPELVRDAVPFGLKFNEALLTEVPHNKNLLLATASGFTQYAYAFVQFEADLIQDTDFAASVELRAQAHKLYLRARKYAIQGLEIEHPGFMEKLQQDPETALQPIGPEDVPFLYWTGVAWAAAIASGKNDLNLVSELYLVEAVMQRALALDENYSNGALHEFFIAFEGGRSDAMGGSNARAQKHFERVVELSQGRRSSPYVSLAENVTIKQQDLKAFRKLLNQALAIEVDAVPAYRLENILAQRRAAWLLSNTENFFLITEEENRQE